MFADPLSLNNSYTKSDEDSQIGSKYFYVVSGKGTSKLLIKHDKPTATTGTNRRLFQVAYPVGDLANGDPSGKYLTINLSIIFPNDGVNDYQSAFNSAILDVIKFISNGTAKSSNADSLLLGLQ